jgi:hypothetical protein
MKASTSPLEKRIRGYSQNNIRGILLLVFIVGILLAVFSLHQLRYIYILPIPEYEKKLGTGSPFAVCEMIKDKQLQGLCFTASKGEDVKDRLRLVARVG